LQRVQHGIVKVRRPNLPTGSGVVQACQVTAAKVIGEIAGRKANTVPLLLHRNRFLRAASLKKSIGGASLSLAATPDKHGHNTLGLAMTVLTARPTP
jgi:hypothetical protein